jgi:hypothetical protein
MASFHKQVDGWLMELGAPALKFGGWLNREIIAHICE